MVISIKQKWSDHNFIIFLGLSNWGEMEPSCKGKHQSPINIDINSAIAKDLKPVIFKHYKDIVNNISLTNNGHTGFICHLKSHSNPSV